MSGPTQKQLDYINSLVNARSQDDAWREIATTMGRSMSAAKSRATKADASATIDRLKK